ncbi:hypothetical protein V6N13_024226 [Hibiscus sabdariffa]|uniref:Uncharacterized protein n=1 Tax=Hibiscus sabdariffa TaxID=183260 RepID=A0ABR2BWU9_9ROSI
MPNATKNFVLSLLDPDMLIVASMETPTSHRSCNLLRRMSLMMSAWVRCQIPIGQCHKCLHLLQPQGCIDLKILTVKLVAWFLFSTCLGQVRKAISTPHILAPFRKGGDKLRVRSTLSDMLLV